MTPFFFGPLGRRLYGVYHAPVERSTDQVLLCAPFGQEAVRTHRMYRLLAEQLARRGVHVLRFDYMGAGESAGDDTDCAPAQCLEDILLAHDELTKRTRAQQTTWLGSRLGATFAAMASARCPTPPGRLVLWEPVLHGQAYLEELAHVHLQETFDRYVHDHRPAAELRNELLGFGISDTWIQQIRAISLSVLDPVCTTECVLVDTADASRANQLAAKVQARGARWRHQVAPSSVAWNQEEAHGAALVPHDLLRVLAAAALGEQA